MSDDTFGPLPENDPWLVLLARHPTPTWIRSTSRHAFRRDEWALLIGTQIVSIGRTQRPCWQVMFEDGTADLWPIHDGWENYQYATQQEKPGAAHE